MKKIILLATLTVLLPLAIDAQENTTSFKENATPIYGYQNSAFGVDAGASNNKKDNVFIGFASGGKNNGDANVFVGSRSGENNTGNRNVFLGYHAGFVNGGSGNVFLGFQAGEENAESSNLLYIENSATNKPLIWGDFENDIVNINGKLGINNPQPTSAFNLGDATVRSDNYMVFGRRLETNPELNSQLPYMGHDSYDGKANDLSLAAAGKEGSINFYTDTPTGTFKGDIRMRIVANGNVGIGINDPAEKLHINGSVRGNASGGALRIRTSGGYLDIGAQNSSWAHIYTDRPKFILNKDIYAMTGGFGSFNTTDLVLKTNGIDRLTINNATGNVGIGVNSADIPADYKMAVGGKIISEEVLVKLQSTWPDYVFNKGYNLPSLQEVEDHIKTNGHLINIPSAKDVEEKGILLGEMNAKLLEKIEELTLYTIQQQKELEAQKDKNSQLEARLSKIESLLSNSEKE